MTSFVNCGPAVSQHSTGSSTYIDPKCDSWHTRSPALLMQRDFISKVLQRIPEEDRHLILLREMEGYSIAQLSKATGLKQSALKARLFRIRRRLLAATTQI